MSPSSRPCATWAIASWRRRPRSGASPNSNLNAADIPVVTTPLLGRRICVIGTSGTGKSYVAQRLARLLGLRYISCDELIWAPNWQPVPRDEQYVAFEAATREDG